MYHTDKSYFPQRCQNREGKMLLVLQDFHNNSFLPLFENYKDTCFEVWPPDGEYPAYGELTGNQACAPRSLHSGKRRRPSVSSGR